MDIKQIVLDLCAMSDEQEWFEFKENHKIAGTTFNQYYDYNKEPYQNYLARNLSPSLKFSFEEIEIQKKRIVGRKQTSL